MRLLPSVMFALVCWAVPSSAQSPKTQFERADAAYTDRNFSRAADLFDSALYSNPNARQSLSLYQGACYNSLAGRPHRAMQLLRMAYEIGYRDRASLRYDPDFDPIRNTAEFKSFEELFGPDTVVYWTDIVKELAHRDHVKLVNKRVDMNEKFAQWFKPKYASAQLGLPLPLMSGDSLIDFRHKKLEFDHCTFVNDDNSYNIISNVALSTIMMFACEGALEIRNVEVDNLLAYKDYLDRKDFLNLNVRTTAVHGLFFMNTFGDFFRVLSSSVAIGLPSGQFKEELVDEWVDLSDGVGLSLRLFYENVLIQGSKFQALHSTKEMNPFLIHLESDRVDITNSQFLFPLKIGGVARSDLKIAGNRFPEMMDFSSLGIPEFDAYIPFEQFANTQMVSMNFDDSISIRGEKPADFADAMLVDHLTSAYKRLYNTYRSRADLKSANSCYIRLKELEIAHLKAIASGGLEDRVRLRLNQFMGFYTRHATSPGRAIIVSIYFVAAFALMYFFFPSDWDRESKKKLISDFWVFAKRNEHGYFKPFLVMVRGFILSFMNATMLSMNAFVTLGFGNIPTSGFARYLCVIEGVMGWFLLSLFTVALLNQVLL